MKKIINPFYLISSAVYFVVKTTWVFLTLMIPFAIFYQLTGRVDFFSDAFSVHELAANVDVTDIRAVSLLLLLSMISAYPFYYNIASCAVSEGTSSNDSTLSVNPCCQNKKQASSPLA